MIDTRHDTNQTAQIKHLLICVRVKENRIQALEDELALLKADREVEERQIKKDRERLAEAVRRTWDTQAPVKVPQKPWYKRILRRQ